MCEPGSLCRLPPPPNPSAAFDGTGALKLEPESLRPKLYAIEGGLRSSAAAQVSEAVALVEGESLLIQLGRVALRFGFLPPMSIVLSDDREPARYRLPDPKPPGSPGCKPPTRIETSSHGDAGTAAVDERQPLTLSQLGSSAAENDNGFGSTLCRDKQATRKREALSTDDDAQVDERQHVERLLVSNAERAAMLLLEVNGAIDDLSVELPAQSQWPARFPSLMAQFGLFDLRGRLERLHSEAFAMRRLINDEQDEARRRYLDYRVEALMQVNVVAHANPIRSLERELHEAWMDVDDDELTINSIEDVLRQGGITDMVRADEEQMLAASQESLTRRRAIVSDVEHRLDEALRPLTELRVQESKALRALGEVAQRWSTRLNEMQAEMQAEWPLHFNLDAWADLAPWRQRIMEMLPGHRPVR